MSNFFDMANEFLDSFSTTTNGATAYKSSGNSLTDFYFKLTYYRNHPDEISTDFKKIIEDPEISNETIARFIFYLGDIRQGMGERNIFRICLREFLTYLGGNRALALLNLVPMYNRWDSVWKVAQGNDELFEDAIAIVNDQLIDDAKNCSENNSVSLLAKWLPSENASSKETKELAKKFIKGLNLTPKKYRILLSTLRKQIDVVERKMSAKQWNEINYETVPSKANVIYSDCFMRNDEDRRSEYLYDLKNNKKKINASVLYPYEIIDRYIGRDYWNYEDVRTNDVYEELWKALPKLDIKNTLVVRDGSGSMSSCVANTTPLSVATALSIYLSENNSGEWKDKFITFSRIPKIIDLSGKKSLLSKLQEVYKHDECENTDIYAVMDMILKVARANHLKQNEMPNMVLIISDMQFDRAWDGFGINETLFEKIKYKYKTFGYYLPKICFWNVAGDDSGTVPLKENNYGLILCSGFSPNIVKMFTSKEVDPYKVLFETINSER